MLRCVMVLALLGLTSCLLAVDEKQSWACDWSDASACPSGMYCSPISRQCGFAIECIYDDHCESGFVCTGYGGGQAGKCERYGPCTEEEGGCRNSDICEDGMCVAPECEGDDDCDGHVACWSGRCVDSCSATYECAQGYDCDRSAGECVEESRIDHCAEDCGVYACDDRGVGPGEYGTCIETCYADTDCIDGYHCNLSNGACEVDCQVSAECSTNQTCVDSACVPTSCNDSDECDAGFACRTGGCTSSCNFPADCADGFVCNNAHTCVLPTCSATDNSSCASFGYPCTDGDQCYFGCVDDFDCQGGVRCQDFECVLHCDEQSDCAMGYECDTYLGRCT